MKLEDYIYQYYKEVFEKEERRPSLKEVTDHLANDIPEPKSISRERVNQLIRRLEKKGRLIDIGKYFYKHQPKLVPVEFFQPNFIEKHGLK